MEIAKQNYYPWIDTLKGIAIIMVVLQHVGFGTKELFAWYHIGQSVPIFLFCSAYLLGKKEISRYFTAKRFKSLWKRIIVPFMVVTIITFMVLTLLSVVGGGNLESIKKLFIKGIKSGGYGPGSYYPWMYIQFWFFIPIVKWVVDRTNALWKSFVAMLLFSICMEFIVSSIVNVFSLPVATEIWRLSFVRYIMLIWIGICFDRIIQYKALWIALATIALVLGTIDIYIRPLIPSYGWNGYHWFSVYYVIPIVLLLRQVNFQFLQTIGKYSWEVFLVHLKSATIIQYTIKGRFMSR